MIGRGRESDVIALLPVAMLKSTASPNATGDERSRQLTRLAPRAESARDIQTMRTGNRLAKPPPPIVQLILKCEGRQMRAIYLANIEKAMREIAEDIEFWITECCEDAHFGRNQPGPDALSMARDGIARLVRTSSAGLHIDHAPNWLQGRDKNKPPVAPSRTAALRYATWLCQLIHPRILCDHRLADNLADREGSPPTHMPPLRNISQVDGGEVWEMVQDPSALSVFHDWVTWELRPTIKSDGTWAILLNYLKILHAITQESEAKFLRETSASAIKPAGSSDAADPDLTRAQRNNAWAMAVSASTILFESRELNMVTTQHMRLLKALGETQPNEAPSIKPKPARMTNMHKLVLVLIDQCAQDKSGFVFVDRSRYDWLYDQERRQHNVQEQAIPSLRERQARIKADLRQQSKRLEREVDAKGVLHRYLFRRRYGVEPRVPAPAPSKTRVLQFAGFGGFSKARNLLRKRPPSGTPYPKPIVRTAISVPISTPPA